MGAEIWRRTIWVSMKSMLVEDQRVCVASIADVVRMDNGAVAAVDDDVDVGKMVLAVEV